MTRTCVGCRARAASGELFRFVAIPGVVGRVALSEVAGPGRGIWTHGTPECLQRSAGRMARICGKPASCADLVASVRADAERRILRGLPALARAGRVVTGRAALAKAEEGSAILAVGTRPWWLPATADVTLLSVDRETLGRAASGAPRRAIALRPGPASSVDRALAVLRALG